MLSSKFVEKIKKPEWKPDFGPAKIEKAGATAIGAREFLVAYNVNLNTKSVRRANSVAFDVREQGRGAARRVRPTRHVLEDRIGGRRQAVLDGTDLGDRVGPHEGERHLVVPEEVLAHAPPPARLTWMTILVSLSVSRMPRPHCDALLRIICAIVLWEQW